MVKILAEDILQMHYVERIFLCFGQNSTEACS